MGLKRVEEIKFFQNPFSILKIMCIFVIQITTSQSEMLVIVWKQTE